VYILLSQLAVGGVHLSVQKYIPQFGNIARHNRFILNSALVLSFFTSLIVVIISLIAYQIPSLVLSSKALELAFPITVWGLIFFSANKVLSAYYNGHRKMKHVALFQFLRAFFILMYFFILAKMKVEAEKLPSILALAELNLFLVMLIMSLPLLNFRFKIHFKRWLAIQHRFGKRAFLGNVLLDVNTRVDVIMLGIFMNDAAVGIYSFASTIAEGFQLLPAILRNNINPIITGTYFKQGAAALNPILNQFRNKFYLIIASLGIISIPIFPFALKILGNEDPENLISFCYTILVSGIILTAGYQPFLMLFNQLGKPKTQTLYVFFIFLANLIGNLVFIQYLQFQYPEYAILGAALGTAFACFMQVIAMKILLKIQFKNKLNI
jgi:O-antigen/teichoic acid export membrane protein